MTVLQCMQIPNDEDWEKLQTFAVIVEVATLWMPGACSVT
jgi:trehalose/maltose hydrolase-like predicted phosphorylase